MSDREKDDARRGVPMTWINRTAIFLAFAFSVVMIFSTLQTYRSFEDMREATNRYITCQQDAALFQEGSDYLTDEARAFAVTGDKSHAIQFVDEIEAGKRRERIVDDADSFLAEDTALDYLKNALARSNALADVECYAIRLMAEAIGDPLEEYPQRIAQIPLKEEDAALSPDEQKSKAVDLVFNDEYNAVKREIRGNVESSVHLLIEETRQKMIDSTDNLNHLLRRQQILTGMLLVTILGVVLFIAYRIIRPLLKNIRAMDQGRPMTLTGAREIRRLAVEYNEMLTEHRDKNRKLSYTATHDALTGLYNRAAYDEAYLAYKNENICILVVDVDKFKEINDSCGHAVGDRALKKVARALQSSFRSNDHISRIGGDEFCVIMKNMSSALTDLVVNKVHDLNQRLSEQEEGLPTITVSVGIAFADRLNPTDDIFKDADAALYRVKENGRGNCAVY